jgi:cation:H+ antiporter
MLPLKSPQRVWLALFDGLLINGLILIIALVFLAKASDLTINNSVKVADISGFGKTTVGFMLVAFATSLPELLVAIFATVYPETIGVAIGNVLGSNIVNICLILGICFLLMARQGSNYSKIFPTIAKEEVGSLYFGLFLASIVPLTLLYIGYASRFIGVILLAIFAFYLYQLSKTKNVKEEASLGAERQKLRKYLLLTLLGVIGVVVTAYFIVDSASYVAEGAGVPRVVIGATVVAFGTSIPELATSIEATRKGHLEMALGNIVGSGFINITFILGVALVASNLHVDIVAFTNLIIFSLITNLFLWYFLSSEKITWRQGAVLLLMYAIFLIVIMSEYRV